MKDEMFNLSWSIDYLILPSAWRGWLMHPGSFMQRLRQHGVYCSAISVIKQAWQPPSLTEKKYLKIQDRKWVLTREVLIHHQNQQWMFARTIFPRASLTGKERRLAQLKSQSLGSVLFRHPFMRRSAFEYACVLPGSPLHNKMQQLTGRQFELLWARRSIFWLGRKKLSLIEIFFPDVLTLENRNE